MVKLSTSATLKLMSSVLRYLVAIEVLLYPFAEVFDPVLLIFVRMNSACMLVGVTLKDMSGGAMRRLPGFWLMITPPASKLYV